MGITVEQFFKIYGPDVLTVVVVLIASLVLIAILGINLNPPKHTHIEKVVTIENFDSKFSDGLCQLNAGEPHKIEADCNTLHEDNCRATSCCIWINGQKCVAGNERGPRYHTDNNKDRINIDYFYYKDKCLGDCPAQI